MAGFGGRNHRGGKRPGSSANSSSSYFSIITVVIFLAFCLLGLWMLTSSSSSIIPSRVTSAVHNSARATLRSFTPPDLVRRTGSDPSSFDDTQGDLPDEAIKGASDRGTAEEEDGDIRLPREDVGEAEQEKESEESGGGEGRQERGDAEEQQVGGDERKAHDESAGDGESGAAQEESGKQPGQQQEADDEEKRTVSEEQSQTDVDEKPSTEQSDQQQTQSDGDDNARQLEQEAQTEGGENQQHSQSDSDETQQQQTQSEGDESSQQEPEQQQQTETEGDENQHQLRKEPKYKSGNHEDQEQEQKISAAEEKLSEPNAGDDSSDATPSEVPTNGETSQWSSTQAEQSDDHKERRKGPSSQASQGDGSGSGEGGSIVGGHNWEICNVTAGPDYIPCLDNEKALKLVRITGHFEHRERHCPEEGPMCLVSLPKGYRRAIEWPRSREKIWYNNVPHTKLAEVKGHQNWVKVTGEYLTFPGGGTQFIHGALHYIDFIQKAVPRIAWGKHTRVILDVGCGVASFGGYLFERDVLAMSFAPKDEHEAQVQFALERGIPAISAVMGTQRLPFPSRVFDIVHCARCRVPWHAEGGRLLLELNRVLRPGGYFVWSATPVYQKLTEDVEIWKAMSSLTASMCWDLVTIKKDRLNSVGAAIYRKPVSNECYEKRENQTPPMCSEDDDASAAWYVPLQSCMHRVPIHSNERGSKWPVDWPRRVEVPPYWLNSSEVGIYGKPGPEDFTADYKHWKRVVNKSYLNGMGISWSKVRNVMDMKAIYGGFAAALKDLNVWVLNVVNIDSADTLPIIYERGLFGLYHDWCESFSTYPRSYDLLHADHLFSGLKKRCDISPVIVEVDRVLRPGGTFILRDEPAIVAEVENQLKSLHWDVRMTFTKGQEGILCAEKTDWRPETFSSSS